MEPTVNALRRQLRWTQLGTVISLVGLGGMGYGVHHLGQQHHKVFSETYQHEKAKACREKFGPKNDGY